MSIDAIRITLAAEKDNEFAFIGADHYALVELLAAHDALKAENERLKSERYELAYAITGGEDAPGLLDSTTLSELLKIAQNQHAMHMNDLGRAEVAESENKELKDALDSDPDGSGLWRFWSSKSSEISQKLMDTVDRAEAAEAEVKKLMEALKSIRKEIKTEMIDGRIGSISYSSDALPRIVSTLDEALKGPICPRPCNSRPDDFSQQDCIAASECGCGKGNTNDN